MLTLRVSGEHRGADLSSRALLLQGRVVGRMRALPCLPGPPLPAPGHQGRRRGLRRK